MRMLWGSDMWKSSPKARNAIATVAAASVIAFSSYFLEGCGSAHTYRNEKAGKVAVLQSALEKEINGQHWQFDKDIALLYPEERWRAEGCWQGVNRSLRESVYERRGDTSIVDVEFFELKLGGLEREMFRWGAQFQQRSWLMNAEQRHRSALEDASLGKQP